MDAVAYGIQGLGAVLLILGHLVLSRHPIRRRLVERFGEGPFLIVYSGVAGLGFGGLVAGYLMATPETTWVAPAWAGWFPIVLAPIALFLIVCGYAQRNPTAIGQSDGLQAEDPAPGILAITRHPVMWGVALLGLSHLPIASSPAALVLFAAPTALALVGTITLDAKLAASHGAAWERLATLTSNLPLLGLLSGKTHFAPREIGVLPVLATAAALVVLVWFHWRVIGLWPLGAVVQP